MTLVPGSLVPGQVAIAQELDLSNAAKAVVRIRACNALGCDRGVGSGVFIDPSGVILTANHVTLSDPDDPLSEPLNDFVVEMIDDWREMPVARYRASLAASDRTNDLALLQIYWDESTQENVEAAALSLPALPLARSDTVSLGQRLHFLGYPLAGGSTINYLDLGLGGFDDEDDSLLKVSDGLSSGYSGGPALLHHGDGVEVLGVVIRQRWVQGGEPAEGTVGLIRSVEEIAGFDWRPDARRVWVEDVEVFIDAEEQGAENQGALDIDLTVRALDYIDDDGLAMAYAYDSASGKPWMPADDRLPVTPTGQAVLSAAFEIDSFLGARRLTLRAPADAFDPWPKKLAFRIVLWDEEEGRALWRDTEWRFPEQAVESSSPPITWPWRIKPLIQSFTPTAQIDTVVGTVASTVAMPDEPTAVPTVAVTPTPSEIAGVEPIEPAQCRVLVRALRLRAGPGTAYVAKGMLNLDENLTPTARNAAATWIEVQAGGGLRGWITNTPNYVDCDGVQTLPVGETPRLVRPSTTGRVLSESGPTSVELHSPPNETNSRDPLIFAWQPDMPLDEGQLFELVFWEPNKGEDHASGSQSWREAGPQTSITLDPAQHAPETYAWGIWLGQRDENGVYQRIRYLGGGWTFTVPSGGGASPETNPDINGALL